MAEFTEHVYQELHGNSYTPLHQREEIVRCRDCANYEYREHLGRSYCCGEYATEPDGFCAWGERRGE